MASVTLSVNIAMYYANTLWLQLEQIWRVAKMYLMSSCVQLKMGSSPGWRLSEMLTNTSLKNQQFTESNTCSRIWTNGKRGLELFVLEQGQISSSCECSNDNQGFITARISLLAEAVLAS
jgi:hypothetical protein